MDYLCLNVILVLIRFANANLFKTSYSVHEQNNILAFLFSVGITQKYQ